MAETPEAVGGTVDLRKTDNEEETKRRKKEEGRKKKKVGTKKSERRVKEKVESEGKGKQ